MFCRGYQIIAPVIRLPCISQWRCLNAIDNCLKKWLSQPPVELILIFGISDLHTTRGCNHNQSHVHAIFQHLTFQRLLWCPNSGPWSQWWRCRSVSKQRSSLVISSVLPRTRTHTLMADLIADGGIAPPPLRVEKIFFLNIFIVHYWKNS